MNASTLCNSYPCTLRCPYLTRGPTREILSSPARGPRVSPCEIEHCECTGASRIQIKRAPHFLLCREHYVIYRSPLPMRKRQPPWVSPRTLGIGLRQGTMGVHVRVGEVPLYASVHLDEAARITPPVCKRASCRNTSCVIAHCPIILQLTPRLRVDGRARTVCLRSSAA